MTFGRGRRASPRWRPPRCSRGGKPAVKDVVEDETPPEPKTETKNDSDGAELQKSSGMLGWFSLDSVAADILSIAAPTVLALAADPITALVDTAFVGHIGKSMSFVPSSHIFWYPTTKLCPKWCLQNSARKFQFRIQEIHS